MAPVTANKKPGKQPTLGKFFSPLAGYKPPSGTRENDEKQDVEMTDAPQNDNALSELPGFADTAKMAEPTSKRRRIAVLDEGGAIVTDAQMPPPKSAKSASPEQATVMENESASEGEEDADSMSVDEEPDLKPKKTVAQKPTPPIEASWEKGSPVPYSALCQTYNTISSTTKRLEILSYLTSFYRTVIALTPANLLQCIYLSINRIGPDYEGLELGVGEGILIKAIAESSGRSLAQIKSDLEKTGDLGDIAQRSKGAQPTMFKPPPLTVPGVFNSLKEIATTSGSASQQRKIGIIKKLLASCSTTEAKYLIRSLEGKLRINLAEKTVLVALAQAIATSQKKRPTPAEITEAEETVKAVFSELPSYDLVVPALLDGGWKGLKDRCKLTPGVPLKPMLAKPTKSISEVLDRFEGREFTCEYKYDGERAQIHFIPRREGERGKAVTKIYSRNSEDMSMRYPDIVEQLPKVIKSDGRGKGGFILDCECVAWDPKEERLLPFQVLSTRKRKDVQLNEVTVKVILFAFDLLYLDGQSLLQEPFKERRRLLHQNFSEVKGEFAFAKAMDIQNIDEIQAFLDESVKDSCEGLMVKMLTGEGSSYEPSKRSMNWLKIKKDYLAGVGDSVDLVVVGAFHGRGKRKSTYGAYLLACYNPETQEYQTICKIGTGFSDEVLDSHTKALKPYIITAKKSYYSHPSIGEQPDVWFEPKFVWEVLCADLSLSPKYRAGIGIVSDNKGISLRFPRFIRVREDKGPEDATTSEQIAEFYRAQINQQSNAAAGKAAKGPLGDGRYADDDFDY